MNLKELKEIIDIVTSKDSIEELEIEKSGVRLRIKKSNNNHAVVAPAASITAVSAPPMVSASSPASLSQEVDDGLFYIKSPIVGTFYRSPSPDTEPFVSAGDFVEKGAVVCIIEAMKLMNEIESEVAGEVVSVLVENGQPVEYGERLLAIRQK